MSGCTCGIVSLREDGRCRGCGSTPDDREAVKVAKDLLGIEVRVYRF
jgi:hypothetical protein